MKKHFIDTNYLIRLTIEDIPAQAEKVEQLFIDASKGKLKIFTSSLVIFEYIWTLSRGYDKFPPDAIINSLKSFMNMDFFEIQNQELLEDAVLIYENENIELQDCFNLAFAKDYDANRFETFDKKLKKVAKKYDL